eukprot:gene8901-9852_t
MEAELQDLHLLSDSVFSNISNITPHLRTLVASAKTYQKSYQATIAAANLFVESIDALAQMASNAKGATQCIGQTLRDIKKMFGEIEEMKVDLMKLFINEVIIPLESKAEQEINMSKLALKQYLQDNRVQTEHVNKATHDIVKLQKKSQRRKSRVGKYESKEEELLTELMDSEKKLYSLRQQGLRRALIGERRIYCFIGDRLCTYGRGLSAYSSRISSMLNQMTFEWDNVISKPSELPKESEEIIANPSTYNTATMRKKDKYFTIDSRIKTATQRPGINAEKPKEQQAISTTTTTTTTTAVATPPPTTKKDVVPPPPAPPPFVPNGNGNNNNGGNQEEHAAVKEVASEEPKVEVNESSLQNELKKVQNQNKMKSLMGEMKLSIVEDSPTQRIRKVSTGSKKRLIAIYSHAAKDASQLTFKKGDIITAISEETSGWQYGQHADDKTTGWFPAAYVESNAPPVASKPGLQHQSQSSQNSSPATAEKTRRISVPAQSTSPYIPAPDYDMDDTSAPKPSSKILLHSSSSPSILEVDDHQVINNNSSPLMALASAMKNGGDRSSPSNINYAGRQANAANDVMPYPPPPPDFATQDDAQDNDLPQDMLEDNPFAKVKLKKTITNDRSKPMIPT